MDDWNLPTLQLWAGLSKDVAVMQRRVFDTAAARPRPGSEVWVQTQLIYSVETRGTIEHKKRKKENKYTELR